MKTKRAENIEALIQRCRAVMALQDKAWSTEKQYLGYIRRFLWFTFTQPAGLSSERKFENFLTEMVLKFDCSVSTQDVAFNAIRWFYQDVLKQKLQDIDALRAQKPKQIRNAPSIQDAQRLLADVRDVANYPTAFLTRLLYERGMRVGEPVALRVKDLRFEQNEIFIHGGKGKKDRIIAMTPAFVPLFQRQLIIAHRTFEMDVRNKIPLQLPGQLAKKYPELKFNWQWAWVFPAHRPCAHPRTKEIVRFHMLKDYVQQAIRESRRRLGIFVLPHELRHGFATHLLDANVNIKAVQEAMGHAHLDTTAGYIHAEAKSVPNPTEMLYRRQTTVFAQPLETRRIEFNPA